ncbi:hypothetical protein PsYK624_120060 [Phanerochaete sordida]|uniref:Uncharacterized protein n=1 Tax=Phanerochaete sordida TaxID=48140 RepID=A0A9P3LHR9_9APHY|nr:hypothetical protein PsYK624_120060 [Phanerochaete sordida]
MDFAAFTTHKVSTEINNDDVDYPDLIRPLNTSNAPIKDAFDRQSATSRATTAEPGADSRQSTRPPDSEASIARSALSRASSVSHARSRLGEAVSARLRLRPSPPRARSTQLPSRSGKPLSRASRSASRASAVPSMRSVSIASRASSPARDVRDDFAVPLVPKREGGRVATPTKRATRASTSRQARPSRARAITSKSTSPYSASPTQKPARGRQTTPAAPQAGPSRRSPSGSPLTDIPDSPSSAKARSPLSPPVSPKTSDKDRRKGKRRAPERSPSVELLSTPPEGSGASPARKKRRRTSPRSTRTLRPRT